MLNLDSAAAIVTGAAGGIGRAIANGLLAHGVSVLFADIDGEGAATAAAEAGTPLGGRVLSGQVDVTSATSVEKLVHEAVAAWDRVDILVNCAGIGSRRMVDELPEDEWRRTLDVNLTGPFLCSKAVLPGMLKRRYGKIVNVASIAAKRTSFNGSAAYTASKAGLVAFTRHLAYEVAGFGINVNAICPGPTLTPMMKTLATDEVIKERGRSIPLGRLIEPDEHMHAVLFLVSDSARAICGVALDVDGGALLGWSDITSYRHRRGAPIEAEVPHKL